MHAISCIIHSSFHFFKSISTCQKDYVFFDLHLKQEDLRVDRQCSHVLCFSVPHHAIPASQDESNFVFTVDVWTKNEPIATAQLHRPSDGKRSRCAGSADRLPVQLQGKDLSFRTNNSHR